MFLSKVKILLLSYTLCMLQLLMTVQIQQSIATVRTTRVPAGIKYFINVFLKYEIELIENEYHSFLCIIPHLAGSHEAPMFTPIKATPEFESTHSTLVTAKGRTTLSVGRLLVRPSLTRIILLPWSVGSNC